MPEELKGVSEGRFTGDPLIFDEEDEKVKVPPVSVCPGCSVGVKIKHSVELGSIIKCGTCGTHLEIMDVNPLILGFYYEEDLDIEGDIDETDEFETIDADELPDDFHEDEEDLRSEENEMVL